jgi:hypothetical protein
MGGGAAPLLLVHSGVVSYSKDRASTHVDLDSAGDRECLERERRRAGSKSELTDQNC